MKINCNTIVLEYGCGVIVDILAEAEYVANLLKTNVEFKFNGVRVHLSRNKMLSEDLSVDCAKVLEAVRSGKKDVYL